MTGWSEPKDQRYKMEKFISLAGTLFVIVNSENDKGKVLKKRILKDLVTRGFLMTS